MELINYTVHQLKKIRAAIRGWRVVREAIDPEYIQYKEVRYKLDRINDDIVPEKEKLKDKKTYPYYLNIETRFGKIKKQFFRTREEADDAMRDHLANKICAWVIKQ
tara:strand:- start:3118 stop:3435 length:318 start_codon:yes stop_codon:yes gene_type:complete